LRLASTEATIALRLLPVTSRSAFGTAPLVNFVATTMFSRRPAQVV
jgi:hypothetical protein